jgi:hypothetical protein
MAGATEQEEQHHHAEKVTGRLRSRLREVFQVNPAGLNWPRAVLVLDVLLVPLVFFWAIGHEQYLLSAVFGLLFAVAVDPGGGYWQRARRAVVFGLFGAGLTALGFGIGGDAWGWLVLAAFAVTLVAGLTLMFGVHRFVAGLLLNIWFIITLAIAAGLHHQSFVTNYTWAQVAAWAGGVALWIVVTFMAWLVYGCRDQDPVIAEIPGDTALRKLTLPLIMFALFRALVMAGTVALAFGANLPHGYWMPIAAIIAMKPSLEQATLFAMQRMAGALLGAGVAILLLLIPANVHGFHLLATIHGLAVVALVILVHGVATRFWNYAVYCAAIAAAVLILLDLPQPTNYGDEGYRVLWTLCGVGIAVIVTILTGLLAKRRAGQDRRNQPGSQSDDVPGVPQPRDPAGREEQARQRAAGGG